MAITNKRLKRYINNNTTEAIRARAKDCKVVDLTLCDDNNSIEAIVNGSSGIPYKVNFTGLITGEILSECSCPYDHGSVCKHEVCLAIESEGFFAEKTKFLEDESVNTTTKKTTPELSYIIKLNKKDSISDLIKKNSHINTYRSLHIHQDLITVREQHTNFITLQIAPDYWRGSFKNITIQKKDNELHLHCSCSKKNNKNLCKHQAMALLYMEHFIPLFFIPEEELNNLKENLLNEYGFTLKDDIHKEYFSFNLSKGKPSLITKKPGIQKLSKFNVPNNNLLTPTGFIENSLPFRASKKTNKKQGLGILFYFDSLDFSSKKILTSPIKGNLNKDNSDLINKIERIDSETFLSLKNTFSDLQNTVIEKALSVNTDYSTITTKKEEIDKIVFQHLKELIELLDENIFIYASFNYYYGDKISKKEIEPIIIRKEKPKLFFKVNEEDHFFTLKSFIELKDSKKAIKKNSNTQNFYFFNVGNEYYLHESLYHAKAFDFFSSQPELRIHKNDFDSYFTQFIQPLSEQFEVIIKHKKKNLKTIDSNELKKQIYLSEHDNLIVLKPIVEYHLKQHTPLSSSHIEIINEKSIDKIKTDEKFELEFIENIQELHSDFKNQTDNFFYLEKEKFLENTWYLDAFETLKTQNVELFGFDKLSKMKYSMHKPTINTTVNSGMDWFDLSIEIKFGDEIVGLKDIQKAIVKKENYIALSDGTIGILPQEWVNKYSHVFRTGDVKKDSINVSKYQLSVIDILYDDLDINSEIAINHNKIKKQLSNFTKIEKVQKPRGLKATLRDYQKEGLNWLNFLDTHGFGGCLADDMGLGKTLQIITFLKHLKNTQKPKIASLVIVPTSLIFNWQEEIKKFSPNLKFLVHTNSHRKKNTDAFNKYDVVFITYGIIMRDIDFLKEHLFNYIILDESQAIKNPSSKRFKSVRLLKSNNKLVLTGTPIENNTFDLYAQMTFVNPGLLGNMTNFKKQYATAIDKNKDIDAANDLRKLINPFLLRRTKEQVAKELPAKTEQILYCTMDKEQQKLYDAYKNKYRNYLLNKIDEEGVNKSKMFVLEGLTKLRQICDSPTLLNDNEAYTNESIKIKELLKHITEKTGKHKILIFSQFVKMLSLIKNELLENKIPFEYLDGKTKDRQAKVDNFQNNEDIRIFLISLKAGGTGLNLTAADYVYLVDPWWNPAVEAQAIDRCYRIGQTKKVMAYKMICKGTIEEKIMQYQEGKKQLSSDIIQTDESFVKNLSKESITDLFS